MWKTDEVTAIGGLQRKESPHDRTKSQVAISRNESEEKSACNGHNGSPHFMLHWNETAE